jgi:hypothetical protein
VQERLGHASMDTYSHVLEGMQQSATGRLSKRARGKLVTIW